MARQVEPCLYCDTVHAGLCPADRPAPKPKAAKPKTDNPLTRPTGMRARAPRPRVAPPTPAVAPPKPSLASRTQSPATAAEDDLDRALRVLVEAKVLHWTDHEKHKRLLRMPITSEVSARVRDWSRNR
jgi:hypothetical protein